MDDLTASVGLTRGALYHNFGDKKGLLAAVVHQIDSAMAQKAQQVGALNAALLVAASDDPVKILPKVIEAFNAMAGGLLIN